MPDVLTTPDVRDTIGKRIVLTCLSNISYAGVVRGIVDFDGKSGAMVQLHQPSGFSVWCPLDFIKTVLVVPIPD
jgi:hypothetical protein